MEKTHRDQFAALALFCIIAGLAGCKTAQKNPELDSLLSQVSYETPSQQVSNVAYGGHVQPVVDEVQPGFAERAQVVRRSIGKGFKSTSRILFQGLIKSAVWSIFDFGDDDERKYDVTSRGRANRNFNGWLDARDKWRQES